MSLAGYQEDEVEVDWYERMVLTGGRADRRRREAKRRKRLRKLITLAVVGAMAISLLVGYISGLVKIVQLRAEISRVEQEIAGVNGEIQLLQEEKDLVESEEYVEKMAREKLGLVMPGEVKYIVTETTIEGAGEQDVKMRSDRYKEPLY